VDFRKRFGMWGETFVPFHEANTDGEAATAEQISRRFSACADLVSRQLRPGGLRTMTLFFLNGMVDAKAVSEYVVRPLLDNHIIYMYTGRQALAEKICSCVVTNAESRLCGTAAQAESALLTGCCVLCLPGGQAIAFETKSGDKRPVGEPSVENVVKGSRDAFVENLSTNTALIRKKLRSARLKTEEFTLGRQSQTKVVLLWYGGITGESMVSQLREKLKQIDVDALLSTGGIEEYLFAGENCLFPRTMYTERPATLASALMTGRAGVLVDGIPLAFLLPATLAALMRAPEDRSQNFIVSSLLNVLRYVSLAAALFLPAFYVALASFHQEMIPTRLMLSVIESKQHVPFTTSEEAIIMLLAFEILLEAGLRLPRNIGQTVSIIGGIIVGQSAVEAKLVSPVIVIIIAAAGITGFTIPNQDLAQAVRVWRFILVVLSSLCGLFALATGAAFLIYRLCLLETLGVPYMAPFSGGRLSAMLKRALLRPPMPVQKNRPAEPGTDNVRSQR